MDVMHTIKYRVKEELGELADKKEWSLTDVGLLGNLVDICKDITTIEAMKKSEKTTWVDENGFEHHGEEDTVSKLKDMMAETRSEEERSVFGKIIDKLTNH